MSLSPGFSHGMLSVALMVIFLLCCGCRKVDLLSVQSVPEPTRDVLVTRDEGGEREFSGFGAAKNDEYADCFIDADKMPEPTIKASRLLQQTPSSICT